MVLEYMCKCPVLRRSSFNIDMGDMVIQYMRELTSYFPALLKFHSALFLILFCGFCAASNDQWLKKATYSEERGAFASTVLPWGSLSHHQDKNVWLLLFSPFHRLFRSKLWLLFHDYFSIADSPWCQRKPIRKRKGEEGNTKTRKWVRGQI